MNYKTVRLVSVLSIAALLLILALLVASVTSCAPLTESSAALATTPTVQDGTIFHPYRLDPDTSSQENWNVTTFQGVEFWDIQPGSLGHARIGDDVLYNNQEYQISALNRKALTMSVYILGN